MQEKPHQGILRFKRGCKVATFHRNLSGEKWNCYEKSRQILNIACELSRARNILKHNQEYARMSIERALELIDLTVDDRKKWSGNSLRELLRFREALAEYYLKENKKEEDLKMITRALLDLDSVSSAVKLTFSERRVPI